MVWVSVKVTSERILVLLSCQESVEGFRVVESTEQDANKEG